MNTSIKGGGGSQGRKIYTVMYSPAINRILMDPCKTYNSMSRMFIHDSVCSKPNFVSSGCSLHMEKFWVVLDIVLIVENIINSISHLTN